MTLRGPLLLVVPALVGALGLASPAANAASPSKNAAARSPASVAHRGHSSKAPENTLAAIRRAARAGADIVEFDVNLTRDDKPVLMHDLYLRRTTNGTGLLEHRSRRYVKKLDAGSWFSRKYAGERVPNQRRAMKVAQSRGLPMLVELKGRTMRDEARTLAARWRKLNAFDSAVATSASRTNLRRIRAADSRIRTGLIIWTALRPAEVARYGKIVLVRSTAISRRYVARLHAAGLRVYAWTADRRVQWASLRHARVDAVSTNRPGRYERWAGSR